MHFRIGSRNSSHSRKSGPIGGGLSLIIIAIAGWFLCNLIFPKLPDYKEAMSRGELVEGRITKVEEVSNITINKRHPKRVTYPYQEAKEGSMVLAMDQKASEGASVTLRVLGENAYPKDLKPLAKPSWLSTALIGAGILGLFLIVKGILRLLVIGGALAVGLHALLGNKSSKQP